VALPGHDDDSPHSTPPATRESTFIVAFSITADISAPPARVWAVMSDVEGWDDWTSTVRNVERLGRGPLALGSRVRIRRPKLPPAAWQVIALDQGRSFTCVATDRQRRVYTAIDTPIFLLVAKPDQTTSSMENAP
jgi:hypothetical protein